MLLLSVDSFHSMTLRREGVHYDIKHTEISLEIDTNAI